LAAGIDLISIYSHKKLIRGGIKSVILDGNFRAGEKAFVLHPSDININTWIFAGKHSSSLDQQLNIYFRVVLDIGEAQENKICEKLYILIMIQNIFHFKSDI